MKLKEQIARALCENDYKGMRVGKRFAWDNCFPDEREKYLNQTEAIMPIIEAEVKVERERCLKVFLDGIK